MHRHLSTPKDKHWLVCDGIEKEFNYVERSLFALLMIMEEEAKVQDKRYFKEVEKYDVLSDFIESKNLMKELWDFTCNIVEKGVEPDHGVHGLRQYLEECYYNEIKGIS
jgi:hypothetical protein